ncbi:hypothetical protein QWU00_11375 [Acetobacter tropicalis]|nr:hypothetical protein [Acetobacter tropicalis]MDO8172347.1 hypothetical protein [Acetobacter tropicalis]
MKTIIWLAHKYGAVKLRSRSVRLTWEPGEGCALIDTTTYQTDTMQKRGFIVLQDGSDDTFILTELGRVKATAMWFEPPRLQECRRKSGLFWISDEQMQWLKPWLPTRFHHLRNDDRKLLSGIVHALRENLSFRQVSGEKYGAELALHGRWAQWCISGTMDAVLGHLFERDGENIRLVVTTEMLLRHRKGSGAIARGELPTFSPLPDLEAA